MKEFPAYMLFNLSDDPHETTNLAESQPDTVNDGLKIMDQWMAERMNESERGDPFHIVIQEGGPLHARHNGGDWRQYCDRLKATGRADHADWLLKNGGKPRDS